MLRRIRHDQASRSVAPAPAPGDRVESGRRKVPPVWHVDAVGIRFGRAIRRGGRLASRVGHDVEHHGSHTREVPRGFRRLFSGRGSRFLSASSAARKAADGAARRLAPSSGSLRASQPVSPWLHGDLQQISDPSARSAKPHIARCDVVRVCVDRRTLCCWSVICSGRRTPWPQCDRSQAGCRRRSTCYEGGRSFR